MGRSVLADTSFLVALLNRRDEHHAWASDLAPHAPFPWHTCEAVLSETFFLLGSRGQPSLRALLHRGVLVADFDLTEHLEPVLALMRRYANLPIGFADACLVRMAETLRDPVVLTTDSDFRIYRRHGRQVVPCCLPG
jgi:predicted nucleic acid-binding protein